ncbi:MAG TPA: GNAT family N-acetyltransferase [Candidatus Limnocylindrales bacterium]|nr:GNAT family N-acetyltransferase [Candidatus Limnocylindrales bacterium]
MVTLVPMSAAAWTTWRAATVSGYAQDNVRIGAWPAEGAEARAAADLVRILPEGQATPGHSFRSVVNDEGATVGSLWFAPNAPSHRRAIFIWDIVIHPSFRGQGYGRATLDALEPIARSLGYTEIELHVFGDNDVARNLYRSAGFVETNVSMVKHLG